MKWPWILSVLVHGFLLLFLNFRPADRPVHTNQPQAEILKVRTLSEEDLQKELAKALETNQKQMVSSDAPQQNAKAPDTPEYFLSKNNQSVDHQTRAAKVGKFKNVPIEKLLQTGLKEKQERINDEVSPLKPLNSSTGMVFKNKKLDRKIASLDDSGDGDEVSASEDYLPDIAVGVQTLLNTKEYKFYGFYERIRERISHEWRNQVEFEVPKLISNGAQPLAADRITQLKVILDPGGNLKGTVVVGSSGYEELDQAALQAFKKAAPFPNPPEQMVEKDGTLSIRWDFVVLASQGYSPQVQVRRVQ